MFISNLETQLLCFELHRQLRIGQRYRTKSRHTTSEGGSTESFKACSLSENVEEEVLKVQFLTQEAVNEQIKGEGFIAPLTRQLEGMTHLSMGW